MSIELGAGRLVVATPTLLDSNFAHTVVLLLDHSADGSLGVVVNRPSDVEVSQVLEEWEDLVAWPRVVFVGGPVQANALLAVGRIGAHPSTGVQPVSDGIGVIDLHEHAADLVGAVTSVRVFAGHSGWGPGQLEEEIATGSWFVLDGEAEDVFSDDPDALWRVVLTRQGGFFSTIPEDPSLN